MRAGTFFFCGYFECCAVDCDFVREEEAWNNGAASCFMISERGGKRTGDFHCWLFATRAGGGEAPLGFSCSCLRIVFFSFNCDLRPLISDAIFYRECRLLVCDFRVLKFFGFAMFLMAWNFPDKNTFAFWRVFLKIFANWKNTFHISDFW